MAKSFTWGGSKILFLAMLLTCGRSFAATPDFQQAVLDHAPILYYQFNENFGNTVNHGSLGAAYDGVLNGTPIRDSATSGGDTGYRFDGSEDYIESLSVAPAGLTGNPTFTVEAVVLIPHGGAASGWAPLLHWGDSAGDPTAKSVYFSFSGNDADEIYAGFYDGGLQTPGCLLPLGSWHHVVWVREGGGTDQVGSTVYIDGADVTSLLEPDPGLCCNGSTPIVTSTEFRINRARDLLGQRFFLGTLDELALYDRALDVAEIVEHSMKLPSIFANTFDSGEPCGWSTVVP